MTNYEKQSTCVIDLAFTPSTGLLITFPQGYTYGYDVSINNFSGLMRSESWGKFYNSHIKGKVPCRKYGKVSISEVLSQN